MSTADSTAGVLELRGLDVGYYKDLNILQDLNVKARKKQITTILGANGVGKSTALKAAFGFLKPNRGDVVLENERSLVFRRISGFSRDSPTFHSSPGSSKT